MSTEKLQSSWVQKDQKYVWHAMSRHNPGKPPLIFTEADGAWLTDIEGNRYLDGKAGLFCVNVGYGRKELSQAAFDQMNKMPYYPLTQGHIPAIQLGEKLNEWLGDEYIIFFSNSGSEANEVAFKIARQYHQQNGEHSRYKFISRYRGYHGSSMGALAATGQAQRKYRYEPLTPGFIQVPPPDSYRCPSYFTIEEYGRDCAKRIEDTITWEMSETIAGVIMEPIITGGGILIPPDNYLKEVREICDRQGALLIIDEVICGFGRTGKPFGFMNYGIKPDIITMAKGLTSAYLPLSATAVKRDLFEVFQGTEQYDHLRHINTFGGNPAACALAIKNMDIIQNEGLVERSDILGRRLLDGLAEIESHPNIGDVRGKGLTIGIELVECKDTKQPAETNKVNQVISKCQKKGLLVGKNGDTVAGYNNVITLGPPLSATDEDINFIIETVNEAIYSLT